MAYQIKLSSYHCLLPPIVIYFICCISPAIADNSLSESKTQVDQLEANYETGVEIGVLMFLGTDFRLFYRESDSPWVFGFRYIDIKDDFVNEAAVGLPNDESDKQYTKKVGVYLEHLFHSGTETQSAYLSGALYKTTIKIECYSESDSDSATSLYVGGGYRGSFGRQFGYKIGLLFSPFVNLEQETTYCSQEGNGDIDLDVSLTFKF